MIRHHKGQALIETILFIPILVMIISAILWFARILITRQQLLSAARYGTDLIVYTDLDEQEIRQEIRNYLTHRWIEGRRLSARRLPDQNILVKIDKFKLPDFAITDDLAPVQFLYGIERALSDLLVPLEHTSYVEILYEFEAPTIFRFFKEKSLVVTARSEVLAGTGCKGSEHSLR